MREYLLSSDNGSPLAHVLISDDGMFAAVSGWGNYAYKWPAFGKDFREFLLNINNFYFADKMISGQNLVNGTVAYKRALKFAEIILPALQSAIKYEMAVEYGRKEQ